MRPSTMTATRSASACASSMKWVVRKTVLPSAQRSLIVVHAWRRADGSKPVVGSSRKSRSGSPTRARARSRRRRWPPERSLTRSALLAGQAHELDELAGRAAARVVAPVHGEDLGHGQLGLGGGLLQDDADALAQRPLAVLGVVAEHAHLAGAARAVALEDLGRGGLARAVGAEEAEDLPGGDGEGDVAHRLHVAVGLAQAVDLDCRLHGYRVGHRGRRGSAARPDLGMTSVTIPPVSVGKYARAEIERRFLLAGVPEGEEVLAVRRDRRPLPRRDAAAAAPHGPASAARRSSSSRRSCPAPDGHGRQGALTTLYLSEAEHAALAALPAAELTKSRLSIAPYGVDVFAGAPRRAWSSPRSSSGRRAMPQRSRPAAFCRAEVTADRRFTGGELVRATRAQVRAWTAEYGVELARR